MKIPLLDLSAQNGPLRAETLAAIERVMDSQMFIMGREVEAFEAQVAPYCGAKHAVGVSSGTDALLLALMALDVKAGDEVITSPYTFFATAGCIARVGAKPVFVDIDPVSFNIDVAALEKAVTPRTRAIMPVHLYGQSADMGPLMEVARRRGLKVIEDAAQAIGTEYKDGRRVGSIGDIGCYSFFPSKNLGAFGDAGLAVTNDDALAERLRVLRVHGMQPKYYHRWIGGNFRIDALQSAVLGVKLRHLDAWTAGRQRNAALYRDLFAKSGLVTKGRVVLPEAVYASSGAGHHHIYNQFVIRAEQRDALLAHLQKQGIGCEIYYPLPLHLQECFSYLGHRKGDFPHSEKAAGETLALPIYSELTPAMIEHVVQTVAAFYR